MVDLHEAAMDLRNGYNLSTVYEFKSSTQNDCQQPLRIMFSLDDECPQIDLPDGQYAVAFKSPDLSQGVEHAVMRDDSPLWFSEHLAGVYGKYMDPLEMAYCVADLMDKCGYWGRFIEQIEPVSMGKTQFLLVHMGS